MIGAAEMRGSDVTARAPFHWLAQERRRSWRRHFSRGSVRFPLLVGVLVALALGACSEQATTTVDGVLPDGTAYELHAPPGFEIGEVEGIGGVLVWTDQAQDLAGQAVGETRFRPARSDEAEDRPTVVDGQLVVPAGSWQMVVDLYDHSIGNEAELTMIEGRQRNGLPVLQLPASLRFARPGELPVELEVMYRHTRVVKGCADYGSCSPDSQIMVAPTGDDAGAELDDVRVEVVPGSEDVSARSVWSSTG